MSGDALSQDSTQRLEQSLTPQDLADRVREELEGLGDVWTRVGVDADLKSTIISAAAKATLDHLCPQKRARRRLSVFDKTDIVVHKIRDTMTELNDLWDQIEMDETRRLKRVTTAYEHVEKLLADMVDSEVAMVTAIREQINEFSAKVIEIRKELGMPPFDINIHPQGSIALWKALEEDVKTLGTKRDNLIEEQKKAIERFGRLTSRLGSDLSDETAASLPDTSVLAPRHTVSDLHDRCARMEKLLEQRVERVLEVQKELLQWTGRMKCDYSENVAAVLEVDAGAQESALTADLMDQLGEIRQTMADVYAEWLSGQEFEYKEQIIRLHELWDMCCVGEGERRLPAEFDPDLLDSLEDARSEVARLERTYESRREVYERMGAWKTHWAEKLNFESSENSLDKYTNRGGSLDQRIKYEARLNKQLLPHAVDAVAEAYSAFLAAHPGEKIYVDGMEPLAYIEHVTSEHDLAKEMEREQKVQAKKAQLLQETKWGSTPASKATTLGRRPLTASASRLAPVSKAPRLATATTTTAADAAAPSNLSFDQSVISPTRGADKIFPKTSSPKGSRVTVAPGMKFNTPSKTMATPGGARTPKRPLMSANRK